MKLSYHKKELCAQSGKNCLNFTTLLLENCKSFFYEKSYNEVTRKHNTNISGGVRNEGI